VPLESSGRGSARWNDADKTNRHVGVDCVTFPDAERACLLEPSNITSGNAAHEATRNCFYSLTFFRTVAWQQPTLFRSIARAASEQHRKMLASRCEEHEIDCEDCAARKSSRRR
jgi:hypothetical protein